jgi:pimeloyl-ACP methyl ester carboxylesterase
MPRRPWPTRGLIAVAFLFAAIGLPSFLPPRAGSLAQAQTRICSTSLVLQASGADLRTLYCTNHPLDRPNEAIDRAIIVFHGAERAAAGAYDGVRDIVVRTQGGDGKTIVIAPHFISAEDVRTIGLPDDMASWRGWAWGDLSQPSPNRPQGARVSSFTIVDALVEKLADKTVFPNLSRLVIVGHSAGGQFTNRYAAGSTNVRTLASRSITMRFIIANPSSYVYFTPERKVGNSQDTFAVPAADIVASCPTYNQYGYGLEQLNNYMARTGATAIPSQYASAEVIYLLGERDTDPNHASLDKSCGAQLQGAHRLERGRVYFNYVRSHFGPSQVTGHRLIVIPGVGHAGGSMLRSSCGTKYLLDTTTSTCRE